MGEAVAGEGVQQGGHVHLPSQAAKRAAAAAAAAWQGLSERGQHAGRAAHAAAAAAAGSRLAKWEITPRLLSWPDMPTSTAAGEGWRRGWKGEGQAAVKSDRRSTASHAFCL
jgi:hypothetical protein